MPPFPQKESSLLAKLQSRATVADALAPKKTKDRSKAELGSVSAVAHGGTAPTPVAAAAAAAVPAPTGLSPQLTFYSIFLLPRETVITIIDMALLSHLFFALLLL
jgi:hypothetical protein